MWNPGNGQKVLEHPGISVMAGGLTGSTTVAALRKAEPHLVGVVLLDDKGPVVREIQVYHSALSVGVAAMSHTTLALTTGRSVLIYRVDPMPDEHGPGPRRHG